MADCPVNGNAKPRKRGRGYELPPPMPVEELRELLGYDPSTGELWWKVARRGAFAGMVAGTSNVKAYISVMIGGIRYQGHRLAWYLMTGDWTDVDHRDGFGGNNCWDNLRAATTQQNGWNQPGRAASGYKGVYPTKSGKWTARIWIDGKGINFPSRETREEAYADYCAAAVIHHGAFARID